MSIKWFDCTICGNSDNGGGIGGWGVHTKLWNKIMFKYGAKTDEDGDAKGMICMDCFEKRLGRKLQAEDFTDTMDNDSNKNVQAIISNNL